jgi:integrase
MTVRHQKGSLKRVRRDGGQEVWVFRWRETGTDGRSRPRKKVIGLVKEFRSETAAWNEVERLDLQINLDRSFEAPKPRTLKELVEHYSATELPDQEDPDGEGLAFATKDNYRSYLRRWIVPQWGGHPFDKVKAVAIESWLKTLWLPECKRWPKGKRLSAGGKKKIRDLMHVLFQHAMRYEWIDHNPISLVRQSGKREEIPTVLNLEQLARLIYVELGVRERTMVLLDFTSGMRRGELSGVKWEDIDFFNKVLNIRRSIVKQRIGKPKTEASKKPIPLSDDVIVCLQEWRQHSIYASDTDYVFASIPMRGTQPYWMSRIMQHLIKPLAEKAGIQGLKGWHTLRHSYATILRQHNGDVKVTQELLRHSSIKVTMDLYAQAVSEEKRVAHTNVVELLVSKKNASSQAVQEIA